jgi:hypothetical protein
MISFVSVSGRVWLLVGLTSSLLLCAKMPAQDCAVVQFSGPYEGTGEIYGALMKWIPEHKYAYAGSPMEIYIKGPHETQKADEYLTEIHFPVMKAEMKPMEMKAGEKPADVKAPEKPAEPKTGGK